MKNLLLFLFLVQVVSFSQDVSYKMGPVIKPSDSNQEKIYENLKIIASGNGIWLPYRVALVGMVGEEIFIHLKLRYGKSFDALLVFGKDLELKKIFSLDQLMDAKKVEFRKTLIFGNEVHLFFTTRDNKVTEEYAALFTCSYNSELEELTAPELVIEVPKLGPDHDYSFNVSQNGKFMAVIADIGTPGFSCYYSFKVFDSEMNVLYEEKAKEIKYDDSHVFDHSHLSNLGNLYLFFDEHTVLRYFDRGNEYFDLVLYDENGEMRTFHYGYEGRTLQKFRILEKNGRDHLYLSWFNDNNWTDLGFKVFDLEDNTEILNHQFDPTWLEPVINPEPMTFLFEDMKEDTPNKLLPTTGVNFIDLLYFTQVDSHDIFVLVKNTDRLSNGGEDVYTPPNFYHRGDIMIFKFEENGGLHSKVKIERTFLTLSNPSYEIVHEDGENLTILYYDYFQEGDATKKLKHNEVKENSFIHSVKLNKRTFEMTDPEIVKITNDEDKVYNLWTESALVSGDTIYALGAAGRLDERLVKIILKN